MRIPSRTIERASGELWVPPGEVVTGDKRDALFSTGVGACMEIAIYDSVRRIGHMAHVHSTAGSQEEAFLKLRTRLRSYDADPGHLMAWVTGGSSDASVPGQPLRTQAMERLADLGLNPDSNLSVEWNDDESLLLATALDCENGVHAVSSTPVYAVGPS